MEETALNEEDHDHIYNNKFFEYLSITVDYLSLPLCLLAVTCDILLCVVILKHKRLRRRHNYHLVGFAIFHSLYIVSTPTLHFIVDVCYHGDVSFRFYCLFLRMENYAILMLLIFTGGYTLEPFLLKRNDKWYRLYEKYFKYLLLSVNILGAVFYSLAAGLCYVRDSEAIGFHIVTTILFLIFGLLFYAYWINRTRNIFPNNSDPLQISLPIILSFLLLLVCYTLLHLFRDYRKVELFFWYTAFLPEFVAYCCCMVVVFRLYRLDKHFRVAFRRLLRRTVQDADYDELNSPDDVEVK